MTTSVPRLFIIEPGAVSRGGHYAAYAQAVAEGAAANGLAPVIVGAARGAAVSPDSGAHFIPGLRTVWHEADAQERNRAQDGLASDLAEALGSPPSPSDRVFYPTLGVADLASVLEAAVTAPVLVEPTTQHLLLRYDPEPFLAAADLLGPLFARVRASPQLSRSVRLHSDTDELAEAYAALTGLPVSRLPIPFPQARLKAHLRDALPAPPPLTLAFFGDARAEKRFSTVADMIDELWDNWVAPGHLAFSLQHNHSAVGEEAAAAAAVQRLRVRPSNRVELIDRPLDENAYYARLARCHAVLIPYDPVRYARRSSGVLVEALAAGRPVIVPAGSWMAARIAPDQGIVYAGDEALAAAVLRLVADYDRLSAGARARSPAEMAASTGAYFVQRMLDSEAVDTSAVGGDGATPTDVENAYRLLLGRRPETRAVVEQNIGATPEDLLGGILASEEFGEGQTLRQVPACATLRRWTATFAGLDGASSRRAEKAASWPALVAALLADEGFRARLPSKVRGWAPELACSLAAETPLTHKPAAADSVPTWAVDEGADLDLVVIAEGSTADTLACLDAVAAQQCDCRVRVLVFNDTRLGGALDAILVGRPWLRLLPGPGALGFARAAKGAAVHLDSPRLAFLSDAVRPGVGWLDEITSALSRLPGAGVVGSKLSDEAGNLLDAGGVLWADGSTWRFGRTDDGRRSRYAFARRSDFVSRLAFAVRADLWLMLDGFDPALGGTAGEADFALRARDRGFETWIQPLAEVILVRPSLDAEDAQAILPRWSEHIGSNGGPGADPLRVMDRHSRKRVLVLEALPLTPERDAGSVVTWSMIRLFQRLGWSVGFAAVNAFDRAAGCDRDLNRIGVETFRAPIANSVNDIIAERPGFYDAVLGFRHGVLHPHLDRLRSGFPLASILFHNQDMHHLRLAREAQLRGDERLARVADLTKDEELDLFAQADCSFITSPVELQLLRRELSDPQVVVLPYVTEMRREAPGLDGRSGVLFVGGFHHGPNIDGALHLARSLWPLICDRLPPEAELLIIGADPPPQLQALASSRVRVLGHVPDLDALFDKARVSVVPLRFGAGVKGKLVKALSDGLPSVVTSLAAEGKKLVSERHALIADGDSAFADAVVRLYTDAKLWSRLQTGGWAFAEEEYSWEAGLARCREALAMADRNWFSRRAASRRARLTDAEVRRPHRP